MLRRRTSLFGTTHNDWFPTSRFDRRPASESINPSVKRGVLRIAANVIEGQYGNMLF